MGDAGAFCDCGHCCSCPCNRIVCLPAHEMSGDDYHAIDKVIIRDYDSVSDWMMRTVSDGLVRTGTCDQSGCDCGVRSGDLIDRPGDNKTGTPPGPSLCLQVRNQRPN
jgi:hypothetical protein